MRSISRAITSQASYAPKTVLPRRTHRPAVTIRGARSVADAFAEPVNPNNEHEVIRRVDQERDESLVMLAETQRWQ